MRVRVLRQHILSPGRLAGCRKGLSIRHDTNETFPIDKWAALSRQQIYVLLVQVALATEERERIVAALEDACQKEAPISVKPGLERLCMEARASQALEGV